jgi:hypothetical protein
VVYLPQRDCCENCGAVFAEMLPPPLIPGTEGRGTRPFWLPRGNIPIVSHRLPNLHFDELTTYIFNKPENRALVRNQKMELQKLTRLYKQIKTIQRLPAGKMAG